MLGKLTSQAGERVPCLTSLVGYSFIIEKRRGEGKKTIFFLILFKKYIYLFIWLHQFLVVARTI